MNSDNQIIDNDLLTNHTADYSFSHGPNFKIVTRIFSIFFIIILTPLFIKSIIELSIIGFIILSLILSSFLYLSTVHSGVQLCKKTKHIRMYSSFIGFKYGKWLTTRNYPDICILTIRKKITARTGMSTPTTTFNKVETGIYILIASHRKRQLITICESKLKADEQADELAVNLNKKIVVFNPKISEATKYKRYR